MVEYIRGWRQVEALWIFVKCLFTRNWRCARRELEIMSGFAKPYAVRFAPSFWASCRESGLSEKDIDDLKRKYEEEK